MACWCPGTPRAPIALVTQMALVVGLPKAGIFRESWSVSEETKRVVFCAGAGRPHPELFSRPASPLLRGSPQWPSAHQLSASNRLGSVRGYVSSRTHSLGRREDGVGGSSHFIPQSAASPGRCGSDCYHTVCACACRITQCVHVPAGQRTASSPVPQALADRLFFFETGSLTWL